MEYLRNPWFWLFIVFLIISVAFIIYYFIRVNQTNPGPTPVWLWVGIFLPLGLAVLFLIISFFYRPARINTKIKAPSETMVQNCDGSVTVCTQNAPRNVVIAQSPSCVTYPPPVPACGNRPQVVQTPVVSQPIVTQPIVTQQAAQQVVSQPIVAQPITGQQVVQQRIPLVAQPVAQPVVTQQNGTQLVPVPGSPGLYSVVSNAVTNAGQYLIPTNYFAGTGTTTVQTPGPAMPVTTGGCAGGVCPLNR